MFAQLTGPGLEIFTCVLWHKYKLSGIVQPYSTFPWFKSASPSIPLIILFSVVSSHRSPVMKVRRHICHVKTNIKLDSALTCLQLSEFSMAMQTYLILFHCHRYYSDPNGQCLVHIYNSSCKKLKMRAKCPVDQAHDYS